MYAIKIEGLTEMRKRFAEAPKTVAPILERATKEAGKEIYRTEVQEAPHQTGNLQRMIKMTYQPIQVEIEPTAKYSEFVHDGTGVYGKLGTPIKPKNAKVLAWRSGGKWIFAKQVLGQKANPFVERTVQKTAGVIQSIFNKALEEIVKAF